MNLVHTLKTPRFEMDYIKFGSGSRSLVVILGMSLKSVVLLASLVAESFKIFANDYTVYLFDRKKRLEDGCSVEEMACDTALALETLGIENADFYGVSQGGMIALVIAEKYPQLVRRLVLASSLSRMNESSRLVFERWRQLSVQRDLKALCEHFVEHVFSAKTLQKYKIALVRSNEDATDEDMERFGVMAQASLEFDCYENLGNVRCPTLVLASRLDQVVFLEGSVEIVDKLKSSGVPCEFYVYDDFGHAAYDEAPDYRKRVLEFLKKTEQ